MGQHVLLICFFVILNYSKQNRIDHRTEDFHKTINNTNVSLYLRILIDKVSFVGRSFEERPRPRQYNSLYDGVFLSWSFLVFVLFQGYM